MFNYYIHQYCLKPFTQCILYLMGYPVIVDPEIVRALNTPHVCLFPHTSKMDGFIFGLYNVVSDYRCCALTNKYQYNHWLYGRLLQWLGTISTGNGNTVQTVVNFLREHPHKTVCLSPEGSISWKPWKRGYYYIAKELNRPIRIMGIDYVEHRLKISPEVVYLQNTDYEEDCIPCNLAESLLQYHMQHSGICPLYPENSNPSILLEPNIIPTVINYDHLLHCITLPSMYFYLVYRWIWHTSLVFMESFTTYIVK